MTKSDTLKALHSSATPEHGTPSEYVEAAREVLGRIDLDPASSEVFNQTVKATSICTKEHGDDGLLYAWCGRVFCNPPSGDNGRLVKAFWAKLVDEYMNGLVACAIWVGFSIDQLQTLQRAAAFGPMHFPICVPRQRIQFVKSLEQPAQRDLFGNESPDPTPVVGESPTKPNFICYLPGRGGDHINQEVSKLRFREVFSRFGEVKL